MARVATTVFPDEKPCMERGPNGYTYLRFGKDATVFLTEPQIDELFGVVAEFMERDRPALRADPSPESLLKQFYAPAVGAPV